MTLMKVFGKVSYVQTVVSIFCMTAVEVFLSEVYRLTFL